MPGGGGPSCVHSLGKKASCQCGPATFSSVLLTTASLALSYGGPLSLGPVAGSWLAVSVAWGCSAWARQERLEEERCLASEMFLLYGVWLTCTQQKK